MKSAIILSLIAFISLCDCKTCEFAPTVANFDPQRFAGPWVSRLESANPRLPCLHYSLALTANGTMACHFLPYGIVADASLINAIDPTQGFNIATSVALINGATMRIVDTDYTSYAAVFTCKEADGVSYHSATIWSRPDVILGFTTILKLKDIYAKYDIETLSLLPILPQTPDPWCNVDEQVIHSGLALLKKFSNGVQAVKAEISKTQS